MAKLNRGNQHLSKLQKKKMINLIKLMMMVMVMMMRMKMLMDGITFNHVDIHNHVNLFIYYKKVIIIIVDY